MKQHITKEQWDQITEKQKQALGWFFAHDVNIGQMIEFLGNNILQIKRHGKTWLVFCYPKDPMSFICKAEFCDALWEGVKSKLNTI